MNPATRHGQRLPSLEKNRPPTSCLNVTLQPSKTTLNLPAPHKFEKNLKRGVSLKPQMKANQVINPSKKIQSRLKRVTFEDEVPVVPQRGVIEYVRMFQNDSALTNELWYFNIGQTIYDLHKVDLETVNRSSHVTMSMRGVKHYDNGTISSYSLYKFRDDFILYRKLEKIYFFRKFYRTRAFYHWMKLRRKRMMQSVSSFLNKEWLLVHPIMKESVLQARTECFHLIQLSLVTIEPGNPKPFNVILHEYSKQKMTQQAKVRGFEENIFYIVKDGLKAIYESITIERLHGKPLANEDHGAYRASFEDTLKNRFSMSRMETLILIKFIRTIDYALLQAKIDLAEKTHSEFLHAITPRYSTIHIGRQCETVCTPPFLLVNGKFASAKVKISPKYTVVRNKLMKILEDSTFELLESQFLLVHDEFYPIMRNLLEISDDSQLLPLNMCIFLKKNPRISHINSQIPVILQESYEKLYSFTSTLSKYIENYYKNREMNKNNFFHLDSHTLRQLIKSYFEQSAELEELPGVINIGSIQFNMTEIKEKLLPVPRHCVRILMKVLPDIITTRSQEALSIVEVCNNQLSKRPKSVDTYVEMVFTLQQYSQDSTIHIQTSEIKALTRLMTDNSIEFPDPTSKQLTLITNAINFYYEKLSENKL